MKTDFLISNIPTGKLNAMVKNIMAQTGITQPEEAVRMMNSGELKILINKWTESDGLICLSVVSDGTSGKAWIERLKSQGIRLSGTMKRMLSSKSFRPTSGKVSKVMILKHSLFKFDDANLNNIRGYAGRIGLSTPDIEIACLLREKLSGEDLAKMELNMIAVMHKPIRIKEDSAIAGIFQEDDTPIFARIHEDPNGIHYLKGGFAFIS